MKIVIAPDSFKGSLTASEVADIIGNAAEQNFPGCFLTKIPIADGGEGTLTAFVEMCGGCYRELAVRGPMDKMVNARYGILPGEKVMIEMSQACGLTLIPREQRNPMKSSSYGLGQILLHVLEEGYRNIIVAIGGSATNDGGIGAMAALGVLFTDKDGRELEPDGESLNRIAEIDVSRMTPLLKEASITVMCDVNNPLLGPDGATYVYGPQKGADEEMLVKLETGMKNYADIIQRKTGISLHRMPGAGAAGGMSAALVTFTGAALRSGIDSMLDAIGFEDKIRNADLVVTGEGKLDEQSACGKVVHGVGKICERHGIPVIAVVGGMAHGANMIYSHGVASIMVTVNKAMELDEAMADARALLADAADRMFRFVRTGITIINENIGGTS